MKKNLFFALIMVAICGATWFWYGAIRRAESRASHPQSASTAKSDMPQPNSEHELKALGEQLKRKPGHAPVLFRMAELERAAGRHTEAVVHLRELLKAEPMNSEALLELGRSLYESGDVQAALAETRKLVEKEPNNVDALYNLGAIYGNLNDLDSARRYWSQAVKASPSSDSGLRAKNALDQSASSSPGVH